MSTTIHLDLRRAHIRIQRSADSLTDKGTFTDKSEML